MVSVFIMVIFVSESFASCILYGLCSSFIIKVSFVPYRHSNGLSKVYCFIKVWGVPLHSKPNHGFNFDVFELFCCGFNCTISELALVFHLLCHVQNGLEMGGSVSLAKRYFKTA
jgi:hypothetical protein